MEFEEINRLFHLVDELTVGIEDSKDEEILSLKEEAQSLYNKIDLIYVRELKNQKMESLR